MEFLAVGDRYPDNVDLSLRYRLSKKFKATHCDVIGLYRVPDLAIHLGWELVPSKVSEDSTSHTFQVVFKG